MNGHVVDPFDHLFAALYARHTQALRFADIRRALQALSTTYVQRRDRLAAGGALDGAGKRAAFALFYGAMHFLTLRAVCAAAPLQPGPVLDLGCGSGAAGAACALAAAAPSIVGVDTHAWAVAESRWTWATLGLAGSARRADLAAVPLRARTIVAAYAVNELTDAGRAALLPQLLAAAQRGSQLRVVEPLSTRVAPWWPAWEAAFVAAGGGALTVRQPVALPPQLALLHRAAGLRGGSVQARALVL